MTKALPLLRYSVLVISSAVATNNIPSARIARVFQLLFSLKLPVFATPLRLQIRYRVARYKFGEENQCLNV
ncbi:hypothetical protein M8C21_002333 [Ambrosia artemisiifolia]|uniref:Uncharacterized protein n=1 Tax=Ambrosia artemisiifolia TaxID=4212 RepID=A0AAD5BP56_AMBAR|nr:hypothetical protein M8C21_013234 [Ambrosia artemisiifolia]KAI7747412.1 hypothetical protein M8C21_002333 [Ambrosia artemisiifolia]